MSQKKVGETAEAIELRQSGENSTLGNLALGVSASLTQVLRWGYWWNATEVWPNDVTKEQVAIELNADFSTKGAERAGDHGGSGGVAKRRHEPGDDAALVPARGDSAGGPDG